jgi:hypothetical protein
MKRIKLKNSEKYFKIDDKDYQRISQHSWRLDSRGYPSTAVDGGTKQIQSFLLGSQPGSQIDHINQNKLDNRRTNLRRGSYRENQLNTKAIGGMSDYKGVTGGRSDSNPKWRAKTKVMNLDKEQDGFVCEHHAAIGYNLISLHFCLKNGDNPSFLDPNQVPAKYKKTFRVDCKKQLRSLKKRYGVSEKTIERALNL